MWEYKLQDGTIHGPFTGAQMRGWRDEVCPHPALLRISAHMRTGVLFWRCSETSEIRSRRYVRRCCNRGRICFLRFRGLWFVTTAQIYLYHINIQWAINLTKVSERYEAQ